VNVGQYVGSERCAQCHEEQWHDWQGSHHDLAMQVASEETVLGDFKDAEYTHFGVRSRFSRRDGRFLVTTEGPDGSPQDYEVEYTFGVEPLQQYLVEFPQGRMQALQVAWDTRPSAQGGQRWFSLQPDEHIPPGDPLHWTGPAQRWNLMCAECHSTGLRRGYQLEEQRYETTWQELDVACEACHGPGSAHAAAPPGGLGVDLHARGTWTLQPGAAIATRDDSPLLRTEIETCAPCHARRSTLRDADVGAELLDSHRPALLEPGLYFADGHMDDEVYVYGSFLQSRMYAAGVTCSDCHDPHALAIEDADATCARCHRSEVFASPAHHHHPTGSAGANCVACHMPARTYMVVDARRDHSFRIPRPALSQVLGAPDACTSCHSEFDQDWADAALRGWGIDDASPHFGQALAAGRRGLGGADRALAALAASEEPAIVRASAVQLLESLPSRTSAEAIVGATRDPSALVRMAAAGALELLPPEQRRPVAWPLLSDPLLAVRIEAGRILAAVPRELWTADESARLEQVLDEYRAAQLQNADRPEVHVNLGALYASRGEFEEAKRAYETALATGPWFVPAYVNLADLYRAQAQDDAGERVLRQGLEQAPDSSALHHALGLLLVRRQQLDAALVSLGRAAALGPETARFAYVYGVALQSAGREDDGLDVLREAHLRHPGSREVLRALFGMERERGDTEAALGYARALAELDPDDADVAALVQSLEGPR
jgi:tetratricopeptide (TPR) repeat protein